MALTIGLSKASGSPRYQNYINWLRSSDVEVDVIDLSTVADIDAELQRLDGLVLTGGSDVDPERYGRPDLKSRCADIDRSRDADEFRMLEVAGERQMPVLAICRGIQVLNVHHGGTLIADLPEVIPGSERHQKEGDTDRTHPVQVIPGTLLMKAAGEIAGEVNSAHHQAIDNLGEGLIVAAKSDDGVVEAVELGDKMGKPYLLGVQWHPERMENQTSGFSRGLLEQFLFEVASYSILTDR